MVVKMVRLRVCEAVRSVGVTVTVGVVLIVVVVDLVVRYVARGVSITVATVSVENWTFVVVVCVVSEREWVAVCVAVVLAGTLTVVW